MKTYRDFLDERKVPRGPWCVNETGEALNREANKAVDKKVVRLYDNRNRKGVASNVPD